MKIDYVSLYEYKAAYGLVDWDISIINDKLLLYGVYSNIETWCNGSKNDSYQLAVL